MGKGSRRKDRKNMQGLRREIVRRLTKRLGEDEAQKYLCPFRVVPGRKEVT